MLMIPCFGPQAGTMLHISVIRDYQHPEQASTAHTRYSTSAKP